MLAAATVAACGGGGSAGDLDGGTPDAPPDGPMVPSPACEEFDDPQLVATQLPLQVAGDLDGAGSDIRAPVDCDVVDAPFGMLSDGADLVIEVDGLVENTEYAVRLDSEDDLLFYVTTDCGGSSGPLTRECLLFVDAQTYDEELDRFPPEVGRFTTDPGQTRAFVVVDHFAAGEPASTGFVVQVYATECEDSSECGGTTPVCQDFRCAGCGDDFDCENPALPICDEPTYTCTSGTAGCAGDDGNEDADDGPAGATPLAPGAPVTGGICDNPQSERDYYRFHVDTPGENWTIQLDWGAPVDLDLRVFDSDGQPAGFSFYESPERIELTYLPVGDYFASVDRYTSGGSTTSVGYTISASATSGSCSSDADCADEYRNQLFRGNCTGGACERIDGGGAVAPGERCDSNSDCEEGSSCSSFFFVADADTRMTCGNTCDSNADCAALGASYVCADYLSPRFCVQKCTLDDHCPALWWVAPTTPPWHQLSCNVASGQCM